MRKQFSTEDLEAFEALKKDVGFLVLGIEPQRHGNGV